MERGLVERAQRGDREAFSLLAAAANARLYKVAQRILRDYSRAEDATQQALVLIWRQLPRLADPDRFEAWSYRVLVNVCYSEIRRDRRAPTPLSVRDVDAPAYQEAAHDIVQRDLLERAFARLTGEQRAVLVLQYYMDFDHREIAAVLGIPLGTVKSRAASGRSALRAAIEADSRSALRMSVP